MELTWKEQGFDYNFNSIVQFQTSDLTEFWSESLFLFYPEINWEKVKLLSGEARAAYFFEVLQQIYHKNQKLMEEKIVRYQAHWDENKGQITEAFSEIFELDCQNRFSDMTGNITLNPVAPRYLTEHSFDVFYLNSERGALGMALHEIMHFVWFDVWQRYFKDSQNEYEIPHLKWILSEMTVEPLMRDTRLASLNPYFPRDYENNQNGCVYDCFYYMKIEGEPILDTLYQMHQQEKITNYMEWAYEYCRKHEKEIRAQMDDVL